MGYDILGSRTTGNLSLRFHLALYTETIQNEDRFYWKHKPLKTMQQQPQIIQTTFAWKQ